MKDDNISYMEIIYLDSKNNARKTDKVLALNTNIETRAYFATKVKPLAVGSERGIFLVDYYNAKGDLCDTVSIDNDGFTSLTGELPLTEEEYIAIDNSFWESHAVDASGNRVEVAIYG